MLSVSGNGLGRFARNCGKGRKNRYFGELRMRQNHVIGTWKPSGYILLRK